MTIASVSGPRSKYGLNVTGCNYFDNHLSLDLMKMSDGWVQQTEYSGSGYQMPTLDANGHLSQGLVGESSPGAGDGKQCSSKVMQYAFFNRRPGTYEFRYTGSLAGGGFMFFYHTDDLGAGQTQTVENITASGQQFTVGTIVEDSALWQVVFHGPITTLPKDIQLFRVSEGVPSATNFSRGDHRTLWGRHSYIRVMDLLGPTGATGRGINNNTALGGRWGTYWRLSLDRSGGLDKHPWYQTTIGDEGLKPTVGATVTGGTSGAVGVLLATANPLNSYQTYGFPLYALVQPTSGTFVAGEVITCSGVGSAAKAKIAAVDLTLGTENGRAVIQVDDASATPTALPWNRAGGLHEWIQMANEAGCGLYVCFPLLGTTSWNTGALTAIRDELYPWLPVKIAYCNEAWWNTAFFITTAHLLGENARLSLGGSTNLEKAMRAYAVKSAALMDLADTIFTGSHAWRLTKVAEGWNASSANNAALLDYDLGAGVLYKTKVNALAIAPYFDSNGVYGQASVAALHTDIATFIAGGLTTSVAANSVVAVARGLSLITYEGGQDQTDDPGAASPAAPTFKTIRSYNLASQAATDYAAWIAMLKANGVTSVTHFTDVYRGAIDENDPGAGGTDLNWGLFRQVWDLTQPPKGVTWLAEVDSHDPAAPSAGTITNDLGTTFTINFTDNSGGTASHRAFMRLTSAGDLTYVMVGTSAPGATAINVTGAVVATAYTIDVWAETSLGISEAITFTHTTSSGTFVVPPGHVSVAPSATSATTNVINASLGDATGSVLARSYDDATYTTLATNPTYPYTDSAFTTGRRAWYRITVSGGTYSGEVSESQSVLYRTIASNIRTPYPVQDGSLYQVGRPLLAGSSGTLSLIGYLVGTPTLHTRNGTPGFLLTPRTTDTSTLRTGVQTFGPIQSAHIDIHGNGLTGEAFTIDVNGSAGGYIDRLTLTEPGSGGITATNVLVTSDGYGRGMGTGVFFNTVATIWDIDAVTRGATTTITLRQPHGCAPGLTMRTSIKGTSGGTLAGIPVLDGYHLATAHATDPYKVTIAVNSSGGSGTYDVSSSVMGVIARHNPTEAGSQYAGQTFFAPFNVANLYAHRSICLDIEYEVLASSGGATTSAVITTRSIPVDYDPDGRVNVYPDQTQSRIGFGHGGGPMNPVFWTGIIITKKMFINPIVPGASKGFPGAIRFEAEFNFIRPVTRLAFGVGTQWVGPSSDGGGFDMPNTHFRAYVDGQRVFQSKSMWRSVSNDVVALTGRSFVSGAVGVGTWDDTNATYFFAGPTSGATKSSGGVTISADQSELDAIAGTAATQGVMALVSERTVSGTRFAYASFHHTDQAPGGHSSTVSYSCQPGTGVSGADGDYVEQVSAGGLFGNFINSETLVPPVLENIGQNQSLYNWSYLCFARTAAELTTSWNSASPPFGKLALMYAALGRII